MESSKETNLGVAQALLTPKGDHRFSQGINILIVYCKKN